MPFSCKKVSFSHRVIVEKIRIFALQAKNLHTQLDKICFADFTQANKQDRL